MSRDELIIRLCKAKGVTIAAGSISYDNTADLEFDILDNFKLKELLTKNTKQTYTFLSLDVILLLDRIRKGWGKPLNINSSYRSISYNKSVGSNNASQHVVGKALDITPGLKDLKSFQKYVDSLNIIGGVGHYNTFTHIDTRGVKARWDERK